MTRQTGDNFTPGETARRDQGSGVAGLRRALREAVAEGNPALVAELSCQIADGQPKHAGAQRAAANALLDVDNFEAAQRYAEKACKAAPEVYGHRLFVGKLQVRLEDHSGALLTLAPAFEDPDRTAELYHVAAQAAEGLGDGVLAVQLARKSWDLEPTRGQRGLALANLLIRQGRTSDAETVLMELHRDPDIAAVALRTLSGLLAKDGRVADALAAIERAIELEPDRSDFILHQTGLLRQAGRFVEARAKLDRLCRERPDDLRIKRSLVAVLAEAGEHNEALQRSAELLAAAPDVEEYVACMQSLLTHRVNRDGADDEGPDVASLKVATAGRRYRQQLGFAQATRRTGEILWALVLREMRTRYSRNRLSFFWALAEPVAHIGVLALLFAVTHRANPPLGNSFLLFYFTGVQPFLIFSHIAQRAGGGIGSARNLLQLPQITPLDLLLSRAIVECVIAMFVVLAVGMILTAAGAMAIPLRPGYFLSAFALSLALGIGMGGLFAILRQIGRAVDIALNAGFRALYLTSGVFFLPGDLPHWVREILLWNPCLHIVDLWRQGYFSTYTAPYSDPAYAALFTLAAVALGTVLLTVATPRLRSLR